MTHQPNFAAHTGEVFSGTTLQDARNKVACKWALNSHAIRIQDNYASHVTESIKDSNLADGLAFAGEIMAGMHADGLAVWQRINTELTGECVPLMAPAKTRESDE